MTKQQVGNRQLVVGIILFAVSMSCVQLLFVIGAWFVIPFGVGIWASIALLIRPGLKRVQPTAEELLAQDPRPPVVFLRSFLDDSLKQEAPKGDLLVRTVVPRNTVEEGVTMILRQLGPVVAIGRPGESLPELGASRIYVSDAEWQDQVSSWARRSRLVVMMVNHATPGTVWEVLHSRDHVGPDRFVLYFPPTIPNRDGVYGEYREMMMTHLPKPLLPYLGSAQFVRFEADWTPQLVESTLALVNFMAPDRKRPGLKESVGTARYWLFVSVMAIVGLNVVGIVAQVVLAIKSGN